MLSKRENLLRFDIVGTVAVLVDATALVPGSGTEARPARNQCQREAFAPYYALFDLDEALNNRQHPLFVVELGNVLHHVPVPVEPIVRGLPETLEIVGNITV